MSKKHVSQTQIPNLPTYSRSTDYRHVASVAVSDPAVDGTVAVFDCAYHPIILLRIGLHRKTPWLFLEWSVALVFRNRTRFEFRIGFRIHFFYTHNLLLITCCVRNLMLCVLMNMQRQNEQHANNTVPIDGIPCCLCPVLEGKISLSLKFSSCSITCCISKYKTNKSVPTVNTSHLLSLLLLLLLLLLPRLLSHVCR